MNQPHCIIVTKEWTRQWHRKPVTVGTVLKLGAHNLYYQVGSYKGLEKKISWHDLQQNLDKWNALGYDNNGDGDCLYCAPRRVASRS